MDSVASPEGELPERHVLDGLAPRRGLDSGLQEHTDADLPVVASQSVKGGGRGNDLLVQSAKGNFAGRAWIHERYVPMRYQDKFWEDVEQDDPPDSEIN